ncbi:MAG: PqqD family protein [Vicinamibacterales bacterium]|nr:PqqD family protein [Vicinamibacterales bacterium]
MSDLHARFVIRPDVVFRTLGTEALLLNLESGMYYGLNPVGTRAWELLQTNDVAGTCDALAVEFEAPVARIREDVLALVGTLVEKGLVEPAGAAAD